MAESELGTNDPTIVPELGIIETDCNDQFQFGAGGAQTSKYRAFPVAFEGQDTQGVIWLV